MYAKRIFGCCTAALIAMSGTVQAGTLDRLRQDNTIRIAYRRDAPPFSFQNGDDKPTGFIVDLCQAVAKRLSQQVNVPSLNVSYVPVTATDRFEAISQGKADLLCEATTVTLSRRKLIDFSLATFADGAGLLTRTDGPKDLRSMGGQAIGVLAGTTTEQALRNALSAARISADIRPAPTHAEGLQMLDTGKVTAYSADRSILWVLQANSKSPDALQLADEYLTIEPYALGLPKGDGDFRFEVDRALSEIYRSGEIVQVLERTFGKHSQPSPLLQSLYLISAIPE
ncbi:MAG TPA: amino acid ABC transporter substrate-binding protein [Acetobacteraceae bacterium]|nr:amino acid ABC transporter substrate-binding protein [Acetobacteraceae bacterium]